MSDFPEFLTVDPGDLYLPRSREEGAEPGKLTRQISRFADSIDGMPPIEVYRDLDGRLIIVNGATRATRVAKLLPGTLIDVEVIGEYRNSYPKLPTVRDKLP